MDVRGKERLSLASLVLHSDCHPYRARACGQYRFPGRLDLEPAEDARCNPDPLYRRRKLAPTHCFCAADHDDFGLGLSSKVVTAWFIVFFLVFFNTFKGGVSIERHIIDFCRTLGASDHQITRTVRIPNALAWAFASLPNAVAFSLIGVVISEFVGSDTGMGYIIITSLSTLNAADMWSAIIVLSATGIMLVVLFSAIERRLLRWSPEFRET